MVIVWLLLLQITGQMINGLMVTNILILGGHLCQRCYRKRKKMDAAGQDYKPPHACAVCQTTDPGNIWYMHPDIPRTYLCNTCCRE